MTPQSPDNTQPSINTERLVLRPMQLEDAPRIHTLVNDKDIAYNCVNIPHPYPEGAAESWIIEHPMRFNNKNAAIFAICYQDEIVGATGLEYKHNEQHYEFGYWIGKNYWGNSFATEASIALLDYAENGFGLDEIYAETLKSNTASIKVLLKAGMQRFAMIEKPCHSPFKLEEVEIFYCNFRD